MKALRGLFSGLFMWVRSVVYAIAIGATVSWLVDKRGVDVILGVVENVSGLTAAEFVAVLIGVIVYVLIVTAITFVVLAILGAVVDYLRSKTPSSRLKRLLRDVRWVKTRLDLHGSRFLSDPEVRERATYVIDELRLVCGVRDLHISIDHWWVLFKMIERPLESGDVRRVKQLYLEAAEL